MDIEVPAAELEGIELQMVRLQELEGLQDDWRVQAEARDEVCMQSCIMYGGMGCHLRVQAEARDEVRVCASMQECPRVCVLCT